jgi:gliding motility-associated-like protein
MKQPIHRLLQSTFILLFSFLSFHNLIAQIEVEPTGTIFTPENLITNVFLGNGVEVINLTYSGDNLAVGYFTNGINDVGMDRGIVMASGFATTAATPNNGGGTTGDTNGAPNDPDLSAITTSSPQDVAIYEITFIPINDTLRFKYAWASEEYPEYACSGFNDAFGFFISGPGINGPFSNNGVNIAFIPDPSDPSGTTFTNLPVTINNVNSGTVGAAGTIANCTPPNGSLAYGQYYNDNIGSMTLTYDGVLDVFIAQAIVIPCQEYTIKLAICDAGDSAFDSAVFLEAKSFGTGSLDVEITTVSLDGTIAEGCSDGALSFSLPNFVENDFPIDYTIFGTATNGVDYQFISEDLFIAAGDSFVTVPVVVFEDGIDEPIETIGIDVQRDPCNRDTFYFYIKDNAIISPMLGPDTTICRLESVQLDGTLDIPLPTPPIFSNEQDFPIVVISQNNPPPPGTPLTTSEIDVFSVQPAILQEGVIKRVCINVDHNWISDVDAYLVSPGGQFIELTTDNGGSGNDYTQTCFTPEATDPINFGGFAPASAAPFTGDWQPEGYFVDLWDGENPTNGTWQLQLKDDQLPDPGTLLGWSICFNPLYQLDYSWEPAAGLSCADCPNPLATPDTTTTYILTVEDTYGCSVTDTITITVLDILPPPVISCDASTNSINFNWEEITDADGYEVSIDGGPWMAATPGPLNHFIDGLALNTAITIVVRGTALCSGEPDTLTCTTLDCTPPTLNIINVSHLDCNGDTDGSISVVANGLFPPFTYMIDNVETNMTGLFSNLPGGDYTVIVTDIGNCSDILSIEVIEPPAMVTTAVVIGDALCSGGEGAATFEVDGGSAPYTFLWSNNTTDSIAMNLPFGDYEATITDAQGCSVINVLSIVEPMPIVLANDMQPVSCNGEGDGTATVISTGGVAPYTYLWDANANNQVTSTAIDLSGGTYTVVVTDFQGCTNSLSITVAEDPAITLAMSGAAALCNTSADGQAAVLASGGAGAPYTYLWNDPLSQTTATATGLQQNTYTVIVTDPAGCTAFDLYEVTAPAALVTSNIAIADATCNAAADGLITFGVSGGTFPYTYAWVDNATVTDSTRNDLLAGDYEVIITDANGCSENMTFTIGEPEAIVMIFVVNNVACNGGASGSALLTASGGTEPYQYLWDANANNQTTDEAINLASGIYSVTITDANGCSNVATTEVEEASDIALTLSQVNVLCFGNSTGNISLTVNGGTAPYVFDWDGVNGFSSTLEDINGLAAGNYTVLVTDDLGCTATASANILQPSTGIMSTMSPEDLICFGGSNGTATVTVGGGTGPFTYQWDNGQTSNTVSNLDAGMHFVTITDSGSCTFVDTAFIAEQEQVFVTLSQAAPDCFNGSNGTANITQIRYGNIAANITDFTIAWSNGQNAVTAINLTGGQSYSVTVTDALGCTGMATTLIDNPQAVGSSVLDENSTTCFGGTDGSATVGGNGGLAPYSYQWDANANNQMTQTATNLAPGDYSVTITDNNGCTTFTSVQIDQPAAIAIALSPTDVQCAGQSDGSIISSIQGGTPPYSYSWSNGATQEDLNGLDAGTYSLTLTDSNGCTNEANTSLETPPLLSAIVSPFPVSCFEDENGRMIIEAEGGTPPYRYGLDEMELTATNHYIGLDAKIYSVNVADANGCEWTMEAEVPEPPALELYIGADVAIEVGSDQFPYQMVSYVANAQGNYTVTWISPYSGSIYCTDMPDDDLTCRNPWVDIDFTTTFTAIAVDENGCEDRDEMTITVLKFRPVSVPTAFTPNDDQVNDRLIVHGVEGTVVKLFRVFDRWGEMVFQAQNFAVNDADPQFSWDGNFKSKALNPGVFTWYVEVVHIDGEEEVLHGHSTLLK